MQGYLMRQIRQNQHGVPTVEDHLTDEHLLEVDHEEYLRRIAAMRNRIISEEPHANRTPSPGLDGIHPGLPVHGKPPAPGVQMLKKENLSDDRDPSSVRRTQSFKGRKTTPEMPMEQSTGGGVLPRRATTIAAVANTNTMSQAPQLSQVPGLVQPPTVVNRQNSNPSAVQQMPAMHAPVAPGAIPHLLQSQLPPQQSLLQMANMQNLYSLQLQQAQQQQVVAAAAAAQQSPTLVASNLLAQPLQTQYLAAAAQSGAGLMPTAAQQYMMVNQPGGAPPHLVQQLSMDPQMQQLLAASQSVSQMPPSAKP
jgi:hypothetical protein